MDTQVQRPDAVADVLRLFGAVAVQTNARGLAPAGPARRGGRARRRAVTPRRA